MLQFSNWTDLIADIAEGYQNAYIELHDDSLLVYGDYDVATDEREVTGESLVWEGQARIIDARWGVDREGDETANASNQTAIRVQIPKNAIGRVKRGMRVHVVECADNPSLLTRSIKVTSDIQGSNAATRTFEASTDSDFVSTQSEPEEP